MKRVTLKRNNLNNPQIKAYEAAVERGMKSQHVLPRNGEWVVKRAGATRASGVFATEKDAVSFGRTLSKKENSCLFVHDKSGRIKSRVAY